MTEFDRQSFEITCRSMFPDCVFEDHESVSLSGLLCKRNGMIIAVIWEDCDYSSRCSIDGLLKFKISQGLKSFESKLKETKELLK